MTKPYLVWVLAALAGPATAQTFEQTPGLVLSFDPAALAAPYATGSVTNHPQSISFPTAPTLAVPQGFAVSLFAQNLSHPRNLIVAPNGDVFLAEQSAGRVTLLRDADGDGRADLTATFTSGYAQPYGLALTATHLYVSDTQAIWRVPYSSGATTGGTRQQITAANALGASSGHSTRNLVLSPAGDRAYVAVGSAGNISEEPEPRATIQEFTLNASGAVTAQRTFAAGVRNPVGMSFYPGTNDLYGVVQERDGMGDELVPDYLTKLTDGGFYGWPYAYLGPTAQPNFTPQNPAQAAARVASTLRPDVLFRSHSAALGITFYTGQKFPAAYRGGAFVALHGSWNASQPRAYNIAFVPFRNNRPAGHYTVFASGFWTAGAAKAQVIGRPSAVAVANDGALLISDDVARVVWRVAYTGGSSVMTKVLSSNAAAGRSYLRLYNSSAAAGTVALTIKRAADGLILGTWTSPAIAPNSSRQFDMAEIEAAASPALNPAAVPAYTVDFKPTFAGAVQQVLWSPTLSAFANMTHCDTGPAFDARALINVHSSRIGGYPSTVRIYNAGAGIQSATLELYDAATGLVVGSWQSPAVAPGAVLDAAMSAVEQGAVPPQANPPVHYVVKLGDGFSGTLQHIVANPNGTIADVTDRCALTP